MKLSKLFLLLPLFLLLVGCRTQNTLLSRERMKVGFTPGTTILPSFPAEALYVLGAQWGENVQHFIQDSVNAHRQAWDKETPTFVVEPAAQQVSDTQYIYWDK